MVLARRWYALALSLLTLLALAPLSAAQGDEAVRSDALQKYAGRWVSLETESTYTIQADGDLLELVSLEGSDGEEYDVKYSSWNGRTLLWKYVVPSTGYAFEEKVHLDGDDALAGEWISTDPDGEIRTGEEAWRRAVPAPPAETQALDGDWQNNSTGATYTIAVDDGHVVLMSITDEDDEAYEVQRSSSNGRVMRWKYVVPGTQSMFEEEVHMRDPDTLEGEWTATDADGDTQSGTYTWTRIVETQPDIASTPPAAELQAIADKLGGTWLNLSTDAIYTVASENGHVELVSVVDDDSEVLQVQKSSWNGRTLRWKYKVPSSGYVVEEEVRLEGPDTLSGEYSSTAPDGEVTRNDDIWTRVKRR